MCSVHHSVGRADLPCTQTILPGRVCEPCILGRVDKPHLVEVSAHIWVKRKLPWVVLPDDHRIFDSAGDWTQDYINDPSRYRPGG